MQKALTNMQKVLALFLFINGVLSFRPFNDLRAHFNPYEKKGGSFKLPHTTRSREIKNYVKVEDDCNLPVDFYCYPNDPRVCLMYDYNGYAAGIQISFLFKDLKEVKKHYDFPSVGFVYSEIFNMPAWGFRAYFTNPETLTSDGRENVSEVVEGLWIYVNNTLLQIERKEKNQRKLNMFYKQNCVPGAGLNYFFIKSRDERSCEELLPLYFFYDKGSLTSFGIGGFGKGSIEKKNWYAFMSREIIENFIPNHPTCYVEWVEKFGFPKVTVFLVERPWEITCP